jgi:hypothetical protein
MNGTKEAFRLIVQRWPKVQGELFDPDPYCYPKSAIENFMAEKLEPAVEFTRSSWFVLLFFKEDCISHGQNRSPLAPWPIVLEAIWTIVGIIHPPSQGLTTSITYRSLLPPTHSLPVNTCGKPDGKG